MVIRNEPSALWYVTDDKQEPSQNAEKDTFSKEIAFFIAGKEKTTALKHVYDALLVIPPTSVEAERVFSAGGLYLTKLRSRMSDETLDKLIFLKFYFRHQDDKHIKNTL